ncbi:SdrD B-like domain-containing protein [Microbacterium sp.]|uniref:SdrD B-like domain-containing protein n=1 Tax=Microbacterium sp. TaxID=51671 RepID=UPI0039E2A2A5
MNNRRLRSRVRTAVAALVTVVVTTALAVSGVTAAHAAGGTVSVLLPNVSEHNGKPVYESGRDYSFQIGYGSMDDGKVVTVQRPSGVTIPESALVVPSGNTAVESLALDADGNIVVTFADPFPSDINQGVLDLKFQVDVVDEAVTTEHVWRYDGEETRTTVLITRPGETPQTVTDAFAKNVGGVNFPAVTIEDGQVVLPESFLEREIPFTITVNSAAAREVTVADELGAHLALVDGSLSGTKDVFDADGVNKATSELTGLPSVSGASFSYTFDAEANSRYTFTYRAKIADADALAALRDELQERYDAVKDNEDGGDYSVRLENTATLNGGEDRTAGTSVGGRVAAQPRPNLGVAFTKTTSRPGDIPVTFAADGVTLDPAIDVEYTLGADLRTFADFADTRHALTRNVVITDTLPAQTEWAAGADFLTADGATFTEVTGVSAAQFAADEYVGTYLRDGDTLLVNVGRDVTTNVKITVKARIISVAGLVRTTAAGQVPPTADAVYTGLGNTARFAYSDDADPASRTVGHRPLEPKAPGSEVSNPDVFRKAGPTNALSGTPGSSIDVPFTFTIGNGVGDVTSSVITDLVDHDVFDVTPANLDEISAGISLRYEWFPENQLGWNGFALDSSFWDLRLTPGGDLEFAVNDAFADALTELGIRTDANFVITITLPTKPIAGKQSLEIVNKASYRGADNGYTYVSSATSRATTFGNEMEVRKRIYDAANDTFTNNLRAEIDADGRLVDDEFVYRVDLIPHGTFTAMVRDVADVLPGGLSFLGFVDPANVGSGEIAATERYSIPGSSLQVVFDDGSNTLTVERGRLTQGQEVTLYFAVRLAEYEVGMGITNVIDGTSATITPTNDYPLNLSKLDADDASVVIDDDAARFQVLGSTEAGQADAGRVVLDGLRVSEGKLRTADGGVPMVTEPGTYWVREVKAPTGYLRTSELFRVVVDETTGSTEVRIFNEPGEDAPAPRVSVGDFVWVDENRDGRQDPGEPGIPGVVLEIVGPNGPVIDVDGEPVGSVTTGPNGEYLFEKLPVLEEGQTYTVRIVRDDPRTVEALTPYVPTRDGVGDTSGDSSTWTATTVEALTEDGDHDPSLDFGFVLKTYAIGDVVWIDADRDGVQGAGEKPLAGVRVVLLGEDGATLATTTTDARGRYIFDELVAGTYRVRFELTEEQATQYAFTRTGAGTDGTDSNADPETGLTATIVLGDDNPHLTGEYDYFEVRASQGIDPTWDAGVVLRDTTPGEPTPTPTPTPGEPTPAPTPTPGETPSGEDPAGEDPAGEDPGSSLPGTGGEIPWPALLAGVLLLAVGGIAVTRRRRLG